MAGHKISGYILSLWQALFASLVQLFTCIFRRTGTTTSKQQPSSEKPPHDSPLPAPAPNPEQQSHSTGQEYHTIPDLERGLQDQEDMVASKKRGGQKRSGVKANGANGANPANITTGSNGTAATDSTSNVSNSQLQKDKENIGPGKQPKQNSASAPIPTSKNSNVAAPSSVYKSDAKVNSSKLSDVQKPNGPKPSSGRTRGRASPQPAENAAGTTPAPSAREAPMLAFGSLAPVVTAVVPTENKSEIQKTGSHIQSGTQTSVTSAKPKVDKENYEALANAQIEQIDGAADRMALDDKPAPKHKEPEKQLDKDSAAVEAAAVPVVVAVPAPAQSSQQPIAPKPLAPLVTPPSQVLPGLIEPTTEEGKIEREHHLKFMREALAMGALALGTNETPVGCVLVYRGRTIAKGMNATNVTRNGTRHAEFMALSALLSHHPDADVKDESTLDESCWGDVDPTDGHIFPYGQKLHPSPKVNRSIISECILYVTVEPCVMCASLLRQLGVKKVYFGAVNDKFGGTGGVFRIHLNSKPVPKPEDRPYQNGYGPHDIERISKGRLVPQERDEDDGDGGNVEPGFPAEGGYLRDEAVSLLRRFYVQENGRAPQPRKKEGRAARLYAMENAQNGGSSLELSDMAPQTPIDTEPSSADQEKFPEADQAHIPADDTANIPKAVAPAA